MEFIPKESDKQWLKNTLMLMANGGVWSTSWAIYKKIDDKTLAVIKGNTEIFSAEQIEYTVNRTKIAAEAIGLKFIDGRR